MAKTQERPNLLLIMTDQQRGDCLGLDGHPFLQTPNMDAIGACGTHFRRAYSEVPSCIPARQVLMSGQAPAVNGMIGFIYAPWKPKTTLAMELRKAGYETRLFGKLHLQPKRHRFGFDAMELADGGGGGDSDYTDWLKERGATPWGRDPSAHGVSGNGFIGRPSHLPEEHTYSAWVVSRALDFLKKRDPLTPFFLKLSFFPPHPPLIPSQVFYDRYDRLDLGEPHIGDWVPDVPRFAKGLLPEGRDISDRINLNPLDMHYCRAGYFGLINEVDAQLSRLMSALRGQILRNTLVLFVSDHGEMLGDHHMFRKCQPFEGSARIPFLARAPDAWDYPERMVSDAPVGLQDVMPTILEAAGLPIPESVTGRSVLPLMRGEKPEWRAYLHGEHCGQYKEEQGNHYLVNEQWKYVWLSQTGRELLFDLNEDPNELHDLSSEEDILLWRERLIDELRERPEGFTDGTRLIAGQPHRKFVPGKGPDVPWEVTEIEGARD